ncbi:hypothetical protein [Acetobacter ascendens]|nr:hypothetical protein [Acetobacter ascendens]
MGVKNGIGSFFDSPLCMRFYFMNFSARTGLAALLLGCATALSAPSAHALTAKECHAKFKEAKAENTLNGQTFKAFKAANCDATTAEAAPAAASKPAEATPEAAKPAAPAAVSASGATFPSAVDPQYSKLSAGKARMKTCLDQYHTNKSSNANGNMKWIQKGGGYYSECNKRLKGE